MLERGTEEPCYELRTKINLKVQEKSQPTKRMVG
ncbi:hypothetical protein SLEP1_g27537 [Rubroshorea leprosula]|uniref:Uncharacterized protein n=1 Tax=Rubroshorea leprosula TaxID=152421 RepID=A0AAV5JTH0_9ROSI|nr:hypothetical protein SLEP1_g27537 [Rubroshorea leprosula]